MQFRKRNRLFDYDYSKDNLYFVTNCVKNNECCLGRIMHVGTGRDLSVHSNAIQNPLIQNPSIQNPSIQNPSIQNPSIQNPLIQNSLIQNPLIQNPSIQNPLIQNPSIQNPLIQIPSIQNPLIQIPSIQNPSIQNPSIQNPLIQNPSIQNPSIQNPSVQNPLIQNPEFNYLCELNQYGLIVEEKINWLMTQYEYVDIHNYIVMPNHFHFILEIDSKRITKPDTKIKSLSSLLGAMKTISSYDIHNLGLKSFAWHRSFHDHIIRNEKSYRNISNYIENNPSKWFKDKFYIQN